MVGQRAQRLYSWVCAAVLECKVCSAPVLNQPQDVCPWGPTSLAVRDQVASWPA